MRMLELFCGAGGAAVGYARAGWEVVGVDLHPQPNFPFEFIQADATTYPLDGFDAYAGGPPCQDHSSLHHRAGVHGTGWMLAHTIERFAATGQPYVVENVATAKVPGSKVTLCGSHFGLGCLCRDGVWRQLRRHRVFISNVELIQPQCRHIGRPIGVYGNGGGQRSVMRKDGTGQRSIMATLDERREALGIDWMTRMEMAQAIPPAYTRFIGEQLAAYV